MKDEIKEILDNLRYTAKKHTIQVLENGGKIEHCPQEIATEIRLNTYSANILLDYITNLQEEKIKIRKILIEHIEEARYELNVILQSDNDLNYKNECSTEFEIINKNIRMILDKIDNILQLEDNTTENLYKYTPEKGFRLVGDDND